MNISLDKKQLKIVKSNKKNIIVIAGAGSGKTFVITKRIEYLINIKKVSEKEILCISFTNDAVNNLKERLKYNIDVMTFHRLALMIINTRKETLTENMLYDIVLNTINNDLLYGLFKINKEGLTNIIVTFINLFKSNNYELDDFNKMIKKANKEEKILLKEIMKCYICYETYLNKENIIDFNDMINLAVKKIDNCNLKYKYIIIDEYQDISYTKFLLIKKLKEKNNASIFAVGDDAQSIYRFAGSSVTFITNFKYDFFPAKKCNLNVTYRCPKLVTKVSTKFINKNPYQIRKNIKCKNNYNNSIEIIYFTDLNYVVNKIINEDKINNLLVLGRNNKDIKNINIKENINYKKMTVHKSKGLGFDYVFLCNVNDSINGFPCKYMDHKILRFVNNYKIKYPYDEERRLFYVALTRCKKRIYLFCNKDNPSIFIKEIEKISNKIRVRIM